MKMTQEELSTKDKARLKQAKRIAITSDCRYKHGCIVTKGGRVMSVGVNSPRNGKELYDLIPPNAKSVHAEEAALRALGGDAVGSVVYVARVNSQGEPRMSKPCKNCTKLLIQAGVKKVVYTISSIMEL